ncbi:MAG: Gfo/Idh/MocA family oxidoreductase [Clostridiales bacterium]|nr:Gfo/Idh/MocA family oxidoreductase [Clostridiales bacterium]
MEKKLNLAIIGQGRSGKDIHGVYYLSERNKYYQVKYVVEADARRREKAEKMYAGCKGFENYQELFACKDIDVVVNASYSEMHYSITKDLLEHGFNVLVEKPFGKAQYECDDLEVTAKKNGVVLAVFQNTQLAPFYLDALARIAKGQLGDVKQISIRYNGFARRWDWQTLQKKVAGSAYNTGPHPIAMALGFLGFDDNVRVAYSKLDRALTSGDAEDVVKIILDAPGKPVVDIEINSTDAFSDYNLKIQGSKGTMKSTPAKYQIKYIVDGENPERPVVETFLQDENGEPLYCSEKLNFHTEEGTYEGTAFDVGTAEIYKNLYYVLTEGVPLAVALKHSRMTIGVIETAHAQNPMPVKF